MFALADVRSLKYSMSGLTHASIALVGQIILLEHSWLTTQSHYSNAYRKNNHLVSNLNMASPPCGNPTSKGDSHGYDNRFK
jgi:hypothetical protein